MPLLKSGRAGDVRFETLEKICEVLDCQPRDLLEYQVEDKQKVARRLPRLLAFTVD